MKTKLIITLAKELKNSVFEDLWKEKYASLGSFSIEGEKLAKTIIIENATSEELKGQGSIDEEKTENNTEFEKQLTINDYTTELVKSHFGYIKTIQTLDIIDAGQNIQSN